MSYLFTTNSTCLLVAPVMPSVPQFKFIGTILVMTILYRAGHTVCERQRMHVRLTIYCKCYLEAYLQSTYLKAPRHILKLFTSESADPDTVPGPVML